MPLSPTPWFKPDDPGWILTDSFASPQARALGELATVSEKTVELYARRHVVSESLAESQLTELLAYAAEIGRVFQQRSGPYLRVELPRRRLGQKYGVLLDLSRTKIVGYNTTAAALTWVAARYSPRLPSARALRAGK